MKRILLFLLCLPMVVLAHDLVVRVDGKTVHTLANDRVEITITGDRVQIDVRAGDQTPVEPPKPDPVPGPPPTGDPRPPGVVTGSLNWRQPGGQKRIGLGSTTLALRFTTTSNPAYSGQVNTSHTTTNPTTRTQWISTQPGGAPLRPRCIASGREGVTLRWSQRADARDCGLEVNTTYYFNVRNSLSYDGKASTCGSNCPFFMIMYTNQRP